MKKYAVICKKKHGDQFETIFEELKPALIRAERDWFLFTEKEKKTEIEYFGVMSGAVDEDGIFDVNAADEVKRYDVMVWDSIEGVHRFDDFRFLCKGYKDGDEGFFLVNENELYFCEIEKHWIDESLNSINDFDDLCRRRSVEDVYSSDVIRDEDYNVIDLKKLIEDPQK